MNTYKRKAYKKSRYRKASQRFYHRTIEKYKPYQSELTQKILEYKADETKEYSGYLAPYPVPII